MIIKYVIGNIVSIFFFNTIAVAEDNVSTNDKINLYLSDVNGGVVSAGNIVGLSGSAINQIQSSQDLVIAFKPFVSSSSEKNGFGLAISPFRTTLLPMSAIDYRESSFMRLAGAFTLSYAQNPTTIDNIEYRKSGFSVESSFYLNKSQDPIIAAQDAFKNCDLTSALLDYSKAGKDDKVAMKAAQKKAENLVVKCIDTHIEHSVPWNASRLSLSLGAGWIKADDNKGIKESLGKAVTFNGIFYAGERGMVNVTLRKTRNEVDTNTLKNGPIVTSSSNLAAARYTYGSKENSNDLKVLIEVSNANGSRAAVSNNVYKYAVGIDKRVMKGVWLEFRVGKSRTFDGTSTQTVSLLNLNIAPSTVSRIFDNI